MKNSKFTLPLEVDDQDYLLFSDWQKGLREAITEAREIRRKLDIAAVRFQFDKIEYTVTDLHVTRKISSELYDILPANLYAKVKEKD